MAFSVTRGDERQKRGGALIRAGTIRKEQGRIHGSISRVRVGRGSIVVGQGQ